MPAIVISRAQPNDAATIKQLLLEADLPGEDFVEHLPHFLMAWENSDLAGVVGLEPYGETGLLRSLVVAAGYRGRGIGRQLCEHIFANARTQGIRKLYLLTTTAANFFPRLGFTVTDRTDAPPVIQATQEFASICPSSAVCMVKKL